MPRASLPSALLLALMAAVLAGCGARIEEPRQTGPEPQFGQAEFADLLNRLAAGWNQGNARLAADCFTADAIYTEPPDKQVYRGRDELFRFFGGESGRAGQMSMAWHHIAYNPATQVGAGEFTFSYGGTVHGVAVIKVRDGRISNWREYWYESPLPWEEFVGVNRF
jgi:SnoaL-like domain